MIVAASVGAHHPAQLQPTWRATDSSAGGWPWPSPPCCGCSPAAAQLRDDANGQAFADALTADDAGLGRFPEGAVARVVELPDDWARTRPQQNTPLWYRLRFDAAGAASQPGLLGLYIERACANLEVQLNGRRLHSAGRMSEPISRDCRRPLLVPLPAALLHERGNALDLRLAGYALEQVGSHERAAGLAAPLIGPYAPLHDRLASDTLLAVTLPEVAAALLLLTGLFALTLAHNRRRDSHLAYFGALSIGWALVTARVWWHDVPLPNYDSELLLASLPAVVTLAAVQFLLHFAGWRSRPIEVALYAQCVAVPASLLLAGPMRLHMLTSTWYMLLVLQVLAAMAFYLWSTYRARRRDFWAMAVLLGLAAATTVIELLLQQRGLPSPWRHLPALLMPVAFLVMAWHLVRQYSRALLSAEDGRQALESRVREASAEMEKNFTQMAELRVEQVTLQERKRIAADLHDDLGAKLLTIVHTSESERISTLAREALEEMRLSVRGLTGKPVKLIDALGDWRAEVVGRLSQTGIEGEWNAPSDESAADPVGARLRTDHAHPARGRQQHHQAQRRVALRDRLPDRQRRLPAGDPGQRQGHPARARRPPGSRPWHGQHEAPRQTTSRAMPGRVRPRLRNRDPPHDSAREAHDRRADALVAWDGPFLGLAEAAP